MVSTLANLGEKEVIPDDKKTVFDWCKEGNVSKLAELVTENNINDKDSQVCYIPTADVIRLWVLW